MSSDQRQRFAGAKPCTPAGLIDHYTLLFHPLTLGTGTRLFEGAEGPADTYFV